MCVCAMAWTCSSEVEVTFLCEEDWKREHLRRHPHKMPADAEKVSGLVVTFELRHPGLPAASAGLTHVVIHKLCMFGQVF